MYNKINNKIRFLKEHNYHLAIDVILLKNYFYARNVHNTCFPRF